MSKSLYSPTSAFNNAMVVQVVQMNCIIVTDQDKLTTYMPPMYPCILVSCVVGIIYPSGTLQLEQSESLTENY